MTTRILLNVSILEKNIEISNVLAEYQVLKTMSISSIPRKLYGAQWSD